MPANITTQELEDAVNRIIRSTLKSAYTGKGEWLDLHKEDTLLPHSRVLHKIHHVTWRTADSIPQILVNKLKQEQDYFLKNHPLPWDKDTNRQFRDQFGKRIHSMVHRGLGKGWLKHYDKRMPIVEMLNTISAKYADILSYVIMPNHVHLLVLNRVTLEILIKGIKDFTEKQINSLICSDKHFWYADFFDTAIHNSYHLERTLYYIINNPRNLLPEDYTLWIRGLGEIYWQPEFRDM